MISTEGRCAREKTIIETDVLVVKSDPLRRKKEQVQVGRDRSRLHLVIRTVLRTGTYTIYDVVSLLGFKDLSRVGKVSGSKKPKSARERERERKWCWSFYRWQRPLRQSVVLMIATVELFL